MRKVPFLVAVVILTGAAHFKHTQTQEPQSDSVPTIASKYGGRIIASLEFTGNTHFTSDFLRSAILNKWIGQPFGYFALKGELSRLKKSAFEPRGYLRAEVGEPQIEEAPEGLRITVPITEGRRYSLGNLAVEGSTLSNIAEIKETPELKRGEILTRLAIDRATDRLSSFYHRAGYAHAVIDIDINWTDPVESPEEGQADLVFKVSEGTTYEGRTIVSIDFEGNSQLSSDILKGALKYVKIGDRFDNDRLTTDLDRLRVLVYADKGFLEAHFGEPEITETNDGIGITLPVNEGRQYRVGSITVEDCTLLSSSEVVQLLRVNTGDLVRGTLIHKGQEKLKELYGARGFIQFNLDLDVKLNDPQETLGQGTVDLVLKLEQGKQYRLRGITFTATLQGEDKGLRDLFRIRDGDTYNPRLVDEGVRAINSLDRFEFIKPEDWKFLADEATGQIDIVIPLNGKAIR